MSDKLEALKAVERFDAEIEMHGGESFAVWSPAPSGSHVSAKDYDALLAALEAKTKARAAAIEQMHFHEQRADVAEQKLAAFPADWTKDSGLATWFPFTAAKLAELEQRLQQPIPESLIAGVCMIASDIYYENDEDKAQDIINRIRDELLGFKVEGE